MKVKVTQEHIDKAREEVAKIKGISGYGKCCMVAMAFKQEYQVLYAPSESSRAYGLFKDNKMVIELPETIEQKIRDFDNKKPVTPFEFEIDL